jgi:hypothetical protein
MTGGAASGGGEQLHSTFMHSECRTTKCAPNRQTLLNAINPHRSRLLCHVDVTKSEPSAACYLCGIPFHALELLETEMHKQLYGIRASLNRLLMGAIFKIKMQSGCPLGALHFISPVANEAENSLSPLFLHLVKRCYG